MEHFAQKTLFYVHSHKWWKNEVHNQALAWVQACRGGVFSGNQGLILLTLNWFQSAIMLCLHLGLILLIMTSLLLCSTENIIRMIFQNTSWKYYFSKIFAKLKKMIYTYIYYLMFCDIHKQSKWIFKQNWCLFKIFWRLLWKN